MPDRLLHLKLGINRVRVAAKRDKTKIFGIGRNKTGTTSLHHAMKSLGYITANQRYAENLHKQWLNDDMTGLLDYCHTAQFFQDVPFSLPEKFKVFDHYYPNSKFILTVRSSSEKWYSSLVRFHSKLWGQNGLPPTAEDLKNATYISPGLAWSINQKLYGDNVTPYDKAALIKSYEDHNENVINHFNGRPDQLLVLDIENEDAPKKLSSFLGCDNRLLDFPWKNKT